jgi:DNA transformation protein
MPASSSLCDHVSELLEPLGDVRIRSMFGGFGVYHRDLFFGLIDDDVLYLKADDETRARYVSRGLKPFVYPSPKGPMEMSYYEAPPEALDDGELLIEWVRLAIEVARRAQASKVKKKPAAKSATSKKPAAKSATAKKPAAKSATALKPQRSASNSVTGAARAPSKKPRR